MPTSAKMDFDPAVVQQLSEMFGVENEPEAVLEALQRLTAQLSPETATMMAEGEMPESIKMTEEEPEMVDIGAGKSTDLASLRTALDVEDNREVVSTLASIYSAIKMATAPPQMADLSAFKSAHQYARNMAPATRKAPAMIPNEGKRTAYKQSPRYGDRGHIMGRAEKPTLGGLVRMLLNAHETRDYSAFKASNYVVGPSGGYTLRVEDRDEMIDALVPSLILDRVGANININEEVAQVEVTKLRGRNTAQWVGMGKEVSESEPQFDVLYLTPKKLMAYWNVPNQMLATMRNGAEDRITNGLLEVVQEAIDAAAFIGAGTVTSGNSGAEPLGLLYRDDVTKTPLGTNGKIPTFDDVQRALSRIREANVKIKNGAFVMNPREWGTFERMTDANGNLILNNYADGPTAMRINGYPVVDSTLLPIDVTTGTKNNTGYIFAGAFENMEVLLAGGISLKVADQPLATRDQTQIIAITHADVQIYHGEAFQVLTGVLPS